MPLFLYVAGMPVIWIMAGILTNGHKGAAAAGAWGLICLVFLFIRCMVLVTDYFSEMTFFDAIGLIVVLCGPPIALLAWGNGDAHGLAWFWTIVICFVIGLVFKLFAALSRWVDH